MDFTKEQHDFLKVSILRALERIQDLERENENLKTVIAVMYDEYKGD